MENIKIKPNGQYYFRFHYKGQYLYVTDKKWNKNAGITMKDMKVLADRAKVEKMKEADNKKDAVEMESHKVRNLFDEYIKTQDTIFKSSTAKAKERRLKNHFIALFSDKDTCEKITPKLMLEFRESLSKGEFKHDTKNVIMIAVKQFIEYLSLKEEITIDNCVKCKQALVPFHESEDAEEIEEEANKHNYMSADEWDRFIATFDHDDKYRMCFLVTYWCGLRIGETLGLEFGDFDYVHCTLTVKRQKAKDTIGFTTPKTKSSRDTIRVKRDVIDEIQQYQVDTMSRDNDVMFPYSRTNLQRVLDKHCEMAGIKQHVSLHGLRHSIASRMLNSDLDLNLLTVQHQMRHASAQVTLSTYAHKFDETDVGKIDRL